MGQGSEGECPIVTIGLLWHSANAGNLGIGALTVAHISIIEEVVRRLGVTARFKVIGWRDTETPYVDSGNVEINNLRAKDFLRPSGLFATVRSCDIVLDISAGDSFADIYGPKRFLFNALAKVVVLAARRPLILSPQTIGPFQRWWTRFLAGMLMSRADLVVARDQLTTDFLRQFDLGSRFLEATDVAFRLPYQAPPDRTDGMVHFGFNVSGLLFNGGYTKDNMFNLKVDYPAVVRSIIQHFSALPSCSVHLVGHVNTDQQEVEDDYRVAQRLAEEFPDVLVAPRFKSPSEAKSYIAGLDFFCGSRMHACIAALSSGVPVLPIAYSRKFKGLFGTLGYSPLTDCTSNSTAEVIETVIKTFEEREELCPMVEDAQQRAKARIGEYERALHEVVSARLGK